MAEASARVPRALKRSAGARRVQETASCKKNVAMIVLAVALITLIIFALVAPPRVVG